MLTLFIQQTKSGLKVGARLVTITITYMFWDWDNVEILFRIKSLRQYYERVTILVARRRSLQMSVNDNVNVQLARMGREWFDWQDLGSEGRWKLISKRLRSGLECNFYWYEQWASEDRLEDDFEDHGEAEQQEEAEKPPSVGAGGGVGDNVVFRDVVTTHWSAKRGEGRYLVFSDKKTEKGKVSVECWLKCDV